MSTSGRFTVLLFSILLLFVISNYSEAQPQLSVANVSIEVRLQSSNALIANCITQEDGAFTFDFQEGSPAPQSGTFLLRIKAMQETISVVAGQPAQSKTRRPFLQTLNVNFTAGTPRPFAFWLILDHSKAQTKGAFAVSGKSDV
jgi:hypothetical protein